MISDIQYDDYRVNCNRGGVTKVKYVFMCWARDAADAFDQARRAGYTPISIS